MADGKLVRDRIPEIICGRGGDPVVRVADPAEYRALLRAKLVEEAGEVLTADEVSVAEELADVLEVIHAMAAELGFGFGQVEKVRVAKAAERGGFGGRIVWEGNRPAVP